MKLRDFTYHKGHRKSVYIQPINYIVVLSILFFGISFDRQLLVSSADVGDVATFTESSPSYPTTTTDSHKKPCTLNETFQAKCLNNGTCFAIETGGQFRPAACSCLTGWIGKRCERKDLGPMLWDASLDVILIVFICIIPVFIASVFLIYYLRKRYLQGTLSCIKKKSTDNNNEFDEPAEDTVTQPINQPAGEGC